MAPSTQSSNGGDHVQEAIEQHEHHEQVRLEKGLERIVQEERKAMQTNEEKKLNAEARARSEALKKLKEFRDNQAPKILKQKESEGDERLSALQKGSEARRKSACEHCMKKFLSAEFLKDA